MHAYEPQLRSRSQRRYCLEIGCLLLAPGEIEARGKFEQIGPVSIEEIGDCAPADVAEEAQWPPNPLHFETTAVAEREEGDMIPNTSLAMTTVLPVPVGLPTKATPFVVLTPG